MVNLTGYQQQAYKRVHVETANPGRILITLYDAAIKFVEKAIVQINDGQAGPKGESLSRAHDIIAEFINALDHKTAPELCSNLERVYGFMLEQISLANTNMDSEPLNTVLKHLKEMRNTWQQAIEQSARESKVISPGIGGVV
jgi:flagellar protein FliS